MKRLLLLVLFSILSTSVLAIERTTRFYDDAEVGVANSTDWNWTGVVRYSTENFKNGAKGIAHGTGGGTVSTNHSNVSINGIQFPVSLTGWHNWNNTNQAATIGWSNATSCNDIIITSATAKYRDNDPRGCIQRGAASGTLVVNRWYFFNFTWINESYVIVRYNNTLLYNGTTVKPLQYTDRISMNMGSTWKAFLDDVNLSSTPSTFSTNITGPRADATISVTDAQMIEINWTNSNDTSNNITRTDIQAIINITVGGLPATINMTPSTAANETRRSDGFEWSLGNFSVTSAGYNTMTNQANGGTKSVGIQNVNATKFIWTIGHMNTTNCSSITVGFYTRDHLLDAGDVRFYANSTLNNWEDITDLSIDTEDTWLLKNFTFTEDIFRHRGFSVRWGGTTAVNEAHWLDDVTVICQTGQVPRQQYACNNQTCRVNVTIPTGLSGAQNLWINLNHTQLLQNSSDLETGAIVYPSSNPCTYTSGNWNVQGSDACTITSNVNLAGNNLTCSGPGSFKVNNANITSVSRWMAIGGCNITAYGGGRIGA